MLRIASLLSLLSLVCCEVSLHAQNNDARQQVEAAETAVQRAIEAKDYKALERLWAPDMVVNSPANRIISRGQVFHAIEMNLLVENDLKNTIESLTTYGDIAVVMGHEVLSLEVGPLKGKVLHRRYTDIWKRSGDGWVQVARQATYLDAQ